jgi:choline-sulfatase
VLETLARRGLAASTAVAVIGDHGESLGDHGEDTHAMFVHEAAVRVPFVLRWPGHLPRRKRIKALARSVDLAPTLLDLAGSAPMADVAGESLRPLIDETALPPNLAYSETYLPQLYLNWSGLRTVQDDRWKFIEAPTEELYDLQADPAERANLAAREPGRSAAFRRALRALSGAGTAVIARQVDRETAAKLAALGYIAPRRYRGPFNLAKSAPIPR